MLVRREAFEAAGGFDEAYRNCLEDTDLCLRPARPATRCTTAPRACSTTSSRCRAGRRSKEIERNAKLFRERWNGRARRDDIDYYVADGLLRVRYRDVYPVGFELAPELAFVSGAGREAVDRLLERQSREVVDLLKETVRLTALAAELGPPSTSEPPAPRRPAADASRRPRHDDAHRQLARAGAGGGAADPRPAVARRGRIGTGATGATAAAGPRSRPPSTSATAT